MIGLRVKFLSTELEVPKEPLVVKYGLTYPAGFMNQRIGDLDGLGLAEDRLHACGDLVGWGRYGRTVAPRKGGND